MAKTPTATAKILAEQQRLEEELRQIPEVELLTELQTLLESPEAQAIIDGAARIGRVLPPGNVQNHVPALINVVTAMREHMSQRQAQIVGELTRAALEAEPE